MRILFTIMVCGLMSWSAKALEKPNILFVLFDELRVLDLVGVEIDRSLYVFMWLLDEVG